VASRRFFQESGLFSPISAVVLTESGLEIKQNSPLKPTFTIELAYGSYGHLPTPGHHALGGKVDPAGNPGVSVTTVAPAR